MYGVSSRLFLIPATGLSPEASSRPTPKTFLRPAWETAADFGRHDYMFMTKP